MKNAPLYDELAGAPDGGRAFWIRSGRRRLRAAVWGGGARGTVIIFNGRSEYIEKYGRVIGELTARGFSVATLDWRGQGLSDRALSDPMKGHIGDFGAYQMDVKALVKSGPVTALPKPRILLGHSMGGCIGLRTLLDETLKPRAVILSAPMFGLAAAPLMKIGLLTLIALSKRFGFETAQALMPNRSKAHVLAVPHAANVLTTDREHFEWMRRHLEAEPGFALGAPTYRWLSAALDETEALADAPASDIPTLIFLGERETVVEKDAILAYDAKAPDCRLVRLGGAKHEALLETPEIRAALWGEVDAFLEDQGL